MKERYKVVAAVWLVVMREGKILLQLRQNTGYMDGRYDMAASGHLEAGERLEDGIVRETKEEIGIEVEKGSMRLVGIGYDEGEGYLRVFFGCEEYRGEPRIMEPEKIAALEWFDVDDLPKNLTPGASEALSRIKQGVFYDIK
jgi:8-oxo-dGTP pyrophosphatase MutT (NUDIX family)